MTDMDATLQFVNYFGELGQRWGLPTDACKIHAYLYIQAKPVTEQEIEDYFNLNHDDLSKALNFLVDYRMAVSGQNTEWLTSDDPWDMLSIGLEERRKRELPEALANLKKCHVAANNKKQAKQALQIKKMLDLVERISILDTQVKSISPRIMKGVMGLSATAAKIFNTTK